MTEAMTFAMECSVKLIGRKEMELLSTKKTCERLGIHPNTLRKWADEGKSKHFKTDAGQRRYEVHSVLPSSTHRRKSVYARVSSPNQKDELANQVRELQKHDSDHEHHRWPSHASSVREHFARGVHFKPKALHPLLDSRLSGALSEVAVSHRHAARGR